MTLYPHNLFPQVYDGIPEFTGIKTGISRVDVDLQNSLTEFVKQQYISDANEDTIREMERMSGIMYNADTESLDFRKARLLNRYSTRIPFTYAFLSSRLDALLGIGMWNVLLDPNTFTLLIQSNVADSQWFEEIKATVVNMAPANIVFSNEPKVTHGILVSEEISATQDRYNYALDGSWNLGELAFVTDDVEVLVKLAEVNTIKSLLLENAAIGIETVIVKVIINDGYAVESPFCAAAEGALAIQYVVPADCGFTEITRIRLVDANDAALTDSVVYIPLSGEATIKHSILFKGGY